MRCVGVTPALELCDCWSLSQLAQLGGPRYLCVCMCVCAWVGAIRHLLVAAGWVQKPLNTQLLRKTCRQRCWTCSSSSIGSSSRRRPHT